MNGYLFYINNIFQIFTKKNFKGWGRKRTGRFALWCHKTFGGNLTLLEDGFIRSVGLGSNLVAPLSLVIDDLGIYFNSQTPSRLEIILQTQSFSEQDLQLAKELKERLIYANIGKYNVGHSDFQIQAGAVY